MTEKEKMLDQMLYDANYDENLLKERENAKELCFDFNNTHPKDTEKQTEIIKKLVGKTKISFCVTAHFGVIMDIISNLARTFIQIIT